MNAQSIIYRPEVVVPDATIDNISPQQLIDAVNIRLSRYSASDGRNIGARTITGNEFVNNPYLPTGSNYTVGACTDSVEGRIFFANWNSNGDHAIYAIYTNTGTGVEEIKPVLRWTGLDFKKDDYVSMAYNRGVIIWCCPTTEPRYVEVQKAINTEILRDTGVAPGDVLETGFAGQYNSYIFEQLKQPPLSPPAVQYAGTNGPSQISTVQVLNIISQNFEERPLNYVTRDGYQFAYNFVYEDFSESRISPPSVAFFGLITTNAPIEFRDLSHYITVQGFDQSYIFIYRLVKKINWYVRKANIGEWVYFSQSVITNGQYNISVPRPINVNAPAIDAYGVKVARIDNLTSIGVIIPAALLAVDGIAKRVKENIFADNRIIHGGLLSGANISMPGATLSVATMDNNEARELSDNRIFIPVKRSKSFAYVFYDKKGRILGTKRIGTIQNPFTAGTFIDLKKIITENPNAFKTEEADYMNNFWLNSNGQNMTNIDESNLCIDITPAPPTQNELDSLVEAEVVKVGLAVKEEFDIPFFTRTQVRTYWVFQDQDGKFIYGYTSCLNKTSPDWKGALRFYGIGFEFNRNTPINFSLEQNYHVSIRSITDHDNYGQNNSINRQFFFDQDFKITAIDKTVLISEQSFQQAGYNIDQLRINTIYSTLSADITNTGQDDAWYEDLWENVAGSNDSLIFNSYRFTFKPYTVYSQTIADVVIYSKIQPNINQYKIIPQISWSRSELSDVGNNTKRYYGDSYKIIANQKAAIDTPNVSTFYFFASQIASGVNNPSQSAGIQKIDNWFVGNDYETNLSITLGSLRAAFTVSSMSFAGSMDCEFAQDLGDVVVENETPSEQNQLRTYSHGEQYLEGTKINNWFTFNPDNRRSVSGNIGNIVRILNQSLTTNQGENIYIYCTQGVEMVYLGKVQQVGTDGTGVLSLSTNIFGTTNVMRLPYGPKKPQHVTQTTLGLTYYFDSANKVLVQVSASGQDSVSEQRKFQTDTRKIADESVIGYDPFTTEVTLIGLNGGLAYNVLEEKYQGKRRFTKNDLLTFISSDTQPKTMYGFYNGQIYRFLNDKPLSGVINVNGSPIIQTMKFVSNHELNKHKVFSFIKLMCEYNNGVDQIDWTAIVEGYNQGQLGVSPPSATTIVPADFVKRNYYYQATIKTTEQIDPFDGPLITGPFIEITLVGDEKYKNLIFAEIGYTLPPAQ